ncbi:MAG: ABC transporter ATP-binding protein [Spirochaetia bacterium]|jgi:iron complex transport system ATP-binding protein|nr:ABC transporter ATP-binding protein [Spirochaetia bacterium]
MTAIQVKDLCFTYDGNTAPTLNDINFSVEEGECVALLGPNGAGKSTLLDIVLSYLPTKHTVFAFGKDILSYDKKERGRLMALVPQVEKPPFSFTCLDYVLFGRAPYLQGFESPKAQDQEIAMQALQEVGMAEFADKPITTLSGGEEQLTLLARAICQDAKILLLDEPTSSLDLGNKVKVKNLIKTLNASGKTILFTTHDPTLANDLADKAAILQRGNLVAFGSLEDCLTGEILSAVYGTKVSVLQEAGKRILITD